MKYLFSIIIFLSAHLVFANEFGNDQYKVTCKAKYQLTGVNGEIIKKVVKDFENKGQDDSYIYWQAIIDDMKLEVHENKSVFFFRPVIQFADGLNITAPGYFDSTGKVAVYASKKNSEGQIINADVRCCKGCTYSDWGK